MKLCVKHLTVIVFLVILAACTSAGKSWLGFSPKLYKGDDIAVEVTRGGLHTISDTEVIAAVHCAKYKKQAKLVEADDPWEIPNRDKYSCVAP